MYHGYLVIAAVSRVAKNLDPDLDIPMNAAPEEVEQKIPDTLSKYFTLDRDFNPVGVSSPTFTASPSLSLSAAGTFLRRGGRTRGERVGGEGLHHGQLRRRRQHCTAPHCKHLHTVGTPLEIKLLKQRVR